MRKLVRDKEKNAKTESRERQREGNQRMCFLKKIKGVYFEEDKRNNIKIMPSAYIVQDWT